MAKTRKNLRRKNLKRNLKSKRRTRTQKGSGYKHASHILGRAVNRNRSPEEIELQKDISKLESDKRQGVTGKEAELKDKKAQLREARNKVNTEYKTSRATRKNTNKEKLTALKAQLQQARETGDATAAKEITAKINELKTDKIGTPPPAPGATVTRKNRFGFNNLFSRSRSVKSYNDRIANWSNETRNIIVRKYNLENHINKYNELNNILNEIVESYMKIKTKIDEDKKKEGQREDDSDLQVGGVLYQKQHPDVLWRKAQFENLKVKREEYQFKPSVLDAITDAEVAIRKLHDFVLSIDPGAKQAAEAAQQTINTGFVNEGEGTIGLERPGFIQKV